MTALNKQAHQTENERMAQSLAERNGEPVEGLRQRISELEEIATDYGMKFQKAQDALKHQALLHKSQLEAAENNLIDSECHVAELEEALRDKQALLEAAEKRIAELSASLKDLIGVVNTVNRSRHHEIKMDDDDDPCYWQRKEWIEYLMEMVSAAEDVYRTAGIGVKGE